MDIRQCPRCQTWYDRLGAAGDEPRGPGLAGERAGHELRVPRQEGEHAGGASGARRTRAASGRTNKTTRGRERLRLARDVRGPRGRGRRRGRREVGGGRRRARRRGAAEARAPREGGARHGRVGRTRGVEKLLKLRPEGEIPRETSVEGSRTATALARRRRRAAGACPSPRFEKNLSCAFQATTLSVSKRRSQRGLRGETPRSSPHHPRNRLRS